MSDHEELEGTVAAWVLGALDADEAESIRVHVEGCATCRQTAARFRRAAGSLPLEVEEVVPPARLRERVLIAASAARASTMPSAPARKRAALAPGRWKPVATVQLGRLTAFAAAATGLLALLVGLVVGGLLGRGSVAPPAPQVARFTLAGHGPLSAGHGTVIRFENGGVSLVDFTGLPALIHGKAFHNSLIQPVGN